MLCSVLYQIAGFVYVCVGGLLASFFFFIFSPMHKVKLLAESNVRLMVRARCTVLNERWSQSRPVASQVQVYYCINSQESGTFLCIHGITSTLFFFGAIKKYNIKSKEQLVRVADVVSCSSWNFTLAPSALRRCAWPLGRFKSVKQHINLSLSFLHRLNHSEHVHLERRARNVGKIFRQT